MHEIIPTIHKGETKCKIFAFLAKTFFGANVVWVLEGLLTL